MDILGLDGLSNFIDDPEKGVEIYAAFLSKASLEAEDREKLKKERGFTDNTIELCQFVSCSPRNREIIESLREHFTEVDLVEAGLLEITDRGVIPCSQLLGAYNKKDQFVNNICIPYFNADGQPFYLRPHKYGFKGKGINIYTPIRKIDNTKPLILAESEFKAAAAIQLGFPAIGVPGIHSFAVNHFSRLRDLLVDLNVKDLVIIYDNEIKYDPLLPNYKPDVLKQWDTQWRAVDIARKLGRSLSSLNVKIGTLPSEWMIDGKIDIDGALAAGKTSMDFRNIIYKAQSWSDYLDVQPTIARKIIHRKIFKEDFLENSPIKKVSSMGDKLGPIGYYIKKEIKVDKDRITVWEPVTNFTMDIYKTIIDGEDYIREIIFNNQDGTRSEPVICMSGKNIQRDFKSWAWSRGDYHFDGSQEDLNKIWRLEGILCDGREIVRPEQIGLVNTTSEPIWLFGNVLIKSDGSMITANSSDGIMWDGLVGYLPRSNREEDKRGKQITTLGKIPTINLDPELTFGLAELKSIAAGMEENYGTRVISLALGWVVACLFSDEIYRRYASFPILFIAGKRESGKTTLGAWLMSLVGQSVTDKSSDSIESSMAGVLRNLAWFSNLPYWLDEYRNDVSGKKWEALFRNVYQRQTPAKGTLGKHVRGDNVNAGLIVSGEETPEDNALLSRCIIIQLHKRKKDKDNPIFTRIENYRSQNLMSRMLLEVIKQRQKLLPIILDAIEGCKKRLLKEGVGDRIALNYAIAAICYDIIFLSGESMEKRRQFLDWVIRESTNKEEEKEREHMLSVFMDDLVSLTERLIPHFTVYVQNDEPKGKRRIAIHFPSFYNEWAKEARRKGLEPFKKQTMMSYIRDEPYYVADNVVKRVQGKPVRSLILSLDPQDNPPDALLYMAASVSESVDDLGKSIEGAKLVELEVENDLF